MVREGRTQPREDLGRVHSPQRDTNQWSVGWRGDTASWPTGRVLFPLNTMEATEAAR